MVQIVVKFNNVEATLRTLKKKLQIENTFKDVRDNKEHRKPSVAKKLKKAEAIKRKRKPVYPAIAAPRRPT